MRHFFLHLIGRQINCIVLLTVALFYLQTLSAQEARPNIDYVSVRHEMMDYYKNFNFSTEKQFDSLYHLQNSQAIPPLFRPKDGNCLLQKKVYGYHPYWFGPDVYNNYQFDLLSTFTYFSYELNPVTGSYQDIHYWKTTPSIDMAKQAGCKVELCVTNFGSSDNTTFLSNSDVWDVLIDSLQNLLQYRGAHGVNIDFEGVPGSQRNNYKAFLAHLADRMHSEMPGSSVTVALYAVDWNNVFDLNFLNQYLDAFIVMGYDYHYSGEAQAGPVAPLYSGALWNQYTLFKTINDYLAEGVSPDKLIMGIPYYGYDWPTDDVSIPAATTATGTARTYSHLRNNFFDTYTRQWDAHSYSPYFIYISSGQTRQCWFEDEVSLANRYDFALDKQLGGVGMWCLGNDNGYTQLWDLLAEKFTVCGTREGSVLSDTGGPLGNYRNNENYTYTLNAPNTDEHIWLTFSAFNLEANFDFLYIYDGASEAAPLIGFFSGSNLPPSVTSTGDVLTLRFVSDGATVSSGFVAEWTSGCHLQTDILPLQTAYNDNFTVFFDDDDNCGNGIEGKYYQVLQSEVPNGQWKGNAQKGFLHDDFDAGTLSSQWVAETGTWLYDDGHLLQNNQSLDNTNLYTQLVQNNNFSYLYQTQLLIGGSGDNRRAGFHFFADEAESTQRGNSYFIYFRPDEQKVQIYKTVDNVFQLKTDETCNINADVWVDVKTTYQPATGQIKVYLNGVLVSQWIDPTPLLTGQYFSLRSAGCTAQYDKVNVFLSRSNNVLVKVGNSATEDDLLAGNGAFLKIYTLIQTPSQWSAVKYAQAQLDVATSIIEGQPAQTPEVEVSLFPNPATDKVFLRLNLPDLQEQIGEKMPYCINVFTCDERLIYSEKYPTTSDLVTLDCSNWPVGIYWLHITGKDFKRTVKFFKR